jgi:flagellar motor switch protein FliN/FliY
MHSFLKAWLDEAPGVLARGLAGELELRPSAQLPQPETAVTLAVFPGGRLQGRFLVTADRYALHALFAAAGVTDGSLDAERDREIWSGMVRQVAGLVTQADNDGEPAASPLMIEEAEWALGLPSAAWELRFGETVLLLAFTDETEPVEIPAAKEAATGPAQDELEQSQESSEDPPLPRYDAPPAIAPGGVDLLLDVELEASFRFGSREMPLNEVLDLGAGDVVELDRHVSDPVDLLVGDKIVARGEVVLVNGSFGLRVLEVAEPRKCLESIRCLF